MNSIHVKFGMMLWIHYLLVYYHTFIWFHVPSYTNIVYLLWK
jgi:hypothetical protein